jgi:predicted nucleic acid-binding protein
MTRHKVFVDTGAWIAITMSGDQHHKEAVSCLNTLTKDRALVYTSNLVIHETYTFLSRKESKRTALKAIDTIQDDSFVSVLHVSDKTEKSAFELLHKWKDQDFGSVDATSFCLMQENNIKKAFSFDEHFRIHGFELIPS